MGLPGGSRRDRATSIARHLLTNPDEVEEDGRNLTDAVVEDVVQRAISHSTRYGEFQFDSFQQNYGELQRALERDGFTVEHGQLRRTLPDVIALPEADDEVHALLDQYGFAVAKGHLDQGIAAHAMGNWAAANAHFRPFIESLFDSTAEYLASCRESEKDLASKSESAFSTGGFERVDREWDRLHGRILSKASSGRGASRSFGSGGFYFPSAPGTSCARLLLRRIAQI
jgi:hypothetical protein